MTTYRVPRRLAFVVPDEGTASGKFPSVFLMATPDGVPLVLNGSAAMIWLLAAHGAADVSAAVAGLVEVDRSAVADDVERFLDHLTVRGLLEVARATGSDQLP